MRAWLPSSLLLLSAVFAFTGVVFLFKGNHVGLVLVLLLLGCAGVGAASAAVSMNKRRD
jgi:uncharacterized membrane-anchored protein